MTVRLTFTTHGRTGTLRGTWDTRLRKARTVLSGTLDGRRIRVGILAP